MASVNQIPFLDHPSFTPKSKRQYFSLLPPIDIPNIGTYLLLHSMQYTPPPQSKLSTWHDKIY